MKVAIVLVSLLAIASAKKTPALVKELEAGPTDIIVRFASTTQTLNTVDSVRFATKTAKRWAVYDALTAFANESQKKVLSFLKGKEIKSTQFWISNELYIKNASPALVEELLQFNEIEEIREDVRVPLDQPVPEVSFRDNNIFNEWNIQRINGHLVHQAGNTGSGVVVSNIDTGVRYTHQALSSNFRGSSYGWFDPYSGTANPIDQNGHGTHTMGTIAGSQGIGVAPGSTWVACRGCDTSACSNSALTACGQWTACPTLPNGNSPDCSRAPDISSNSWGGGRGQTWYDSVVRAWHSAGIIPVFANGNSGSSCSTANSPADSQAGVIAVGSTTNTNAVSSFSSRGPSAFGGIKPDIAAPGSAVRSAYHTSDSAYSSLSGTSMACPHVAGAAALVLARNPNLSYSQLSSLLYRTSFRGVSSSQTCGGVSDSVYPNNQFGAGIVDAYAAYQGAFNV